MNEENIDFERLRKDLIDYFGTAMMFNPLGIMELSKVEKASNSELLKIAINNGFNINDYKQRIR